MSETKQPYKWYWAYESGGTTYLFNTFDAAYNDAVGHGEFEDCCGKDAWYSREENLFFEVREDEVEEYAPAEFKEAA